MDNEDEEVVRTPFHCQLDNERHPATEDRYQCRECGRILCCECYEAQKTVGMLVCPFCSGNLEFQKSKGKKNPPTSSSLLFNLDSVPPPIVVPKAFDEALALHKLGNLSQAAKLLDAILKQDPSHIQTWNEKGRVLEDLDQPIEALYCYNTAIDLDPSNATYWNNKGFVLDGLNRHEAAIQCYDKALELDPSDANIWINKSAALGQLKQYSEALTCIEKALMLNPQLIDAWFNRGRILEILGYEEAALKCYEKILELDPNDLEAKERKTILMNQLKMKTN